MDSCNATLPPEIWKHILDHLSSRREDLAACRSVCKDFKALSSEFLFRRVTFAKRLDTIDRLWNILEHTELRTYVTELVYDASTYEESLATDFENYEEACSTHSARVFSDVEATMQVQKYAKFYRKICRDRPWRGAINESRKWYKTGIHKGFHDYFTKWLAQSQMIKDGLDSDVVTEALVRLPRLRRIAFTDYRDLAREGEGYAAVCGRIFGNTLEPLGISFSNDICREFMLLMYMIAETPQANIQSLLIGGHPYESLVDFWASNEPGRRNLLCSFDPPAMHYEPDHYPGDVEWTQQVCRKLRQLRLPIRFQGDIGRFIASEADSGMGDSFVGKMLASSASGLVQLSLSALDLLQGSYDKGLRTRTGGDCVDSLLCALTFPALRHLELCGWPLPGQPFQEFLSKHSSNLKELCLVECVFPNDPRSLGRWAGSHMFLSGVNMNARIWDDDGEHSEGLDQREVRELEALWLAGRPNTLR
jgi:hypothetical protein